ncbi:T9SS type A sorting domain-containing protein [Plebeiibacterium sediminum]|uniref:T9SS type A sorting domain-containing protein n=1 Tax=Plebeiibacterium sediminum TaxID=2992112 RepID=A0AAE3SFH6_9BACT|nr:T9SS type A sorting domain-containing protein [Plebeiobacterium sediminum]MCW3787097.1 T9SS type A sorting domain-containing protein [Plebeiobacterium sediminum]
MKQTFTLLGFLLLSITFCAGQSNLKRSNKKKSFHELLQSAQSQFKALNTIAISKTSSNLKTASSYSYSLDGYTYSFWYNDSWVVGETYEFTYNSDDLLSTVILYEENSDDKYLSTYTYDDNGNISALLRFSWNETENDWYSDAWYRELYTYDTDGNLTQSISSERVNGNWSDLYKVETTYNDYGYDTRKEYEYNSNTSGWDNLIIAERTYDAQGFVTLLTISERDDVNSEWGTMYGVINSTDSENHILSYSAYDGDPDDSNSSIGEKGIFTFVNGNISNVEYQIEDESGNWYTYDKVEYTYDTNYTISDILMPFISNTCFMQEGEINSEFNNKILTYTQYDIDNSSQLFANEKLTYNYTDLSNPLGIDDAETIEVKLYPNPAYNVVSFSFSAANNKASIQIFDMLGKVVLEKEISNEQPINIESLNSGIYLYNIVVDGQTQSGKLYKK